MTIAETKILSLTNYLVVRHWKYGYGSKIPLSIEFPDYNGGLVDCSGFVRWAWYHMSSAIEGKPSTIPDGSVNQDEYFKSLYPMRIEYTYSRSMLTVGFLPPSASHDGVGHAFYILSDGFTCESCGAFGPTRRKVNTLPWLSACEFYNPIS